LQTITITAYRRSSQFEAALKTLVANDLAGWRILVGIEPSSIAREIANIAETILQGHDYNITTNSTRLGIKENPFQLIERAFAAGSELNLYLEEDLLLSPDVTTLARWYFANHRPEWLCLSLISGGCGSAGLLSNPDHPDLLFAGHAFNSLGFAFRRKEWEINLRGAWMAETAPIVQFDGALTSGWDWSIFAMLMNNPDLRTLQPALARSTHNGRIGGEHCTPVFHDAAFAGLPIHCGAEVLSYRVAPLDVLPNVVRRHAQLWYEMTQALKVLAQRSVKSGIASPIRGEP
jgi:hypothetical protein